MSSIAVRSTKAVLNVITKLVKADVRLHNAHKIEDDMTIIYVVNHFTRLETLLLPFEIEKATGVNPWSLASAGLFRGKIGSFLRAVGTISTKDPDRDRHIVRSLLCGDHPWIIFPEGMMIKDKKIVDGSGMFRVRGSEPGERRPPHTGAAVLALRAEFYRHKLSCLADAPDPGPLGRVLDRFELEAYAEVEGRRTVIVPVNVTYFPIRARENLLYNLATSLAPGMSTRALEELSIESSILASNSDVDITLGDPIEVRPYLDRPGNEELMACGENDMDAFEQDPRSMFNELARELMHRYMGDIYELTTVNYDHIFSNIIRHQKAKEFNERAYRNRIFLAAHEILKLKDQRVHGVLRRKYRDIIYEDPSPQFHDFMQQCLDEGLIDLEGGVYQKNFKLKRGFSDFHAIRRREITYVIANEIEPLTDVLDIIKKYAKAPRKAISRMIREMMLEEDRRIFKEDYAEYAHHRRVPKSSEIAEPFLLVPRKIKAGLVLIHGYLAAPLEVRKMAEYFHARGYVVYGVRLKGHGTAPEDLARTQWEEWYESANRGYAVIKSYTDDIVLGGFSTGGGLALLSAARKGDKIRAVFSINAPLQLRSYAVHLIPPVHAVNKLLGWFNRSRKTWKYIENEPENENINYRRNPVSGVRQLSEAMKTMESSLGQICVPTLIVQGSRDPVVDPVSGRMIFHKVGTREKEMLIVERGRHGIINGEGAEEIFDRVDFFLNWAEKLRQRGPIEIVEDGPGAARGESAA